MLHLMYNIKTNRDSVDEAGHVKRVQKRAVATPPQVEAAQQISVASQATRAQLSEATQKLVREANALARRSWARAQQETQNLLLGAGQCTLAGQPPGTKGVAGAAELCRKNPGCVGFPRRYRAQEHRRRTSLPKLRCASSPCDTQTINASDA